SHTTILCDFIHFFLFPHSISSCFRPILSCYQSPAVRLNVSRARARPCAHPCALLFAEGAVTMDCPTDGSPLHPIILTITGSFFKPFPGLILVLKLRLFSISFFSLARFRCLDWR